MPKGRSKGRLSVPNGQRQISTWFLPKNNSGKEGPESSSSSSSSKPPPLIRQDRPDSAHDTDTAAGRKRKHSAQQLLKDYLPKQLESHEDSLQKLEDCIRNHTFKTLMCKPATKKEITSHEDLIKVLKNGLTEARRSDIIERAEKSLAVPIHENKCGKGAYMYQKKGGGSKCGAAFWQTLGTRVLGQQADRIAKGSTAMTLLTLSDAEDLIPDELVGNVLTVNPIPWFCHKDQEKKLHPLIKLQVLEAYVTSCWAFDDGVIAELLFKVPSPIVRAIFHPPKQIHQDAKKYLNAETVIYLLLSWSTLQNDLDEAAKKDEDLRARRPEPREEEFIKNLLFTYAASKKKIIGKTDAIPTSPAMDFCKMIADEFIEMIPDDVVEAESPLPQEDKDRILERFGGLKNKNDYMRPDLFSLGRGVDEMIPRVNQELAEKDTLNNPLSIFLMEHASVRAWKVYRNEANEYVQELLDEEFKVDFGNNVHLRRHKQSGRLVLVTPSYFLIFAPPGKVSHKVRLRLLRSYVVLLDLLHAVDCTVDEHWETIRNRLLSFAMWLHCPFGEEDEIHEDFDEYLGNGTKVEDDQEEDSDEFLWEEGSFDQEQDFLDEEQGSQYFSNSSTSTDSKEQYNFIVARSQFCPKGYFRGPIANVMNVAKLIGIPSNFLQGIQHHTGLSRMVYIVRQITGCTGVPLDPNFKCPCCGYNPPHERDRKNVPKNELRMILHTGNKWPGFWLNNENLCFHCGAGSTGPYNRGLLDHFNEKDSLTSKESKKHQQLSRYLTITKSMFD